MNKMQEQVLEFHKAFGVAIAEKPTMPSLEVRALRMSLIREEVEELAEAFRTGDLIAAADALADIKYVVLGTNVTMGLDAEKFFDEVHRSNMTKVWDDGTVHYRDDGKVLKPPTYSPANIAGILSVDSIPEGELKNL